MTNVIINLTDVFGRPITSKIRFTPTGSTVGVSKGVTHASMHKRKTQEAILNLT